MAKNGENKKKEQSMEGNGSQNSGISPVTAGALGVVAGVVGATALAMQNKKIEKVVKEEVDTKVADAKKIAKAKADDIKKTAVKKITRSSKDKS